MKPNSLLFALALLALALGGCTETGSAVVFAPTPLPPDDSPVTYVHPGGVFEIDVPRPWSLHEQYTTQLASAAFAPPGSADPLLLVSVARLGDDPGQTAFAELISQYQTQVRPDLDAYTETARAPMGDGSWRISGYHALPGGRLQAVNTFIERAGPLFAVTEVVLPDDPATAAALEAAVNSLRLTPPGSLAAGDLTALAHARPADLSVLHATAWATPDGVFYVTGEIANAGFMPLIDVPVEVVLTTSEGTPLVGAVDTALGHVLPPGGFAPFSLRFGGGQPTEARQFIVRVGGDGWMPAPAPVVLGGDTLSWTDQANFADDGTLAVSGDVSNTGEVVARQVRATVTVFDGAGNVIGAASQELSPPTIAPGEGVAYRFAFTELGGVPVNYIVSVQALE